MNEKSLSDLAGVSEVVSNLRMDDLLQITGQETEGEDAERGYNEKCDNWSIGVIAYRCLSGIAPFTKEAVMTKVAN